jgi:putative transposase
MVLRKSFRYRIYPTLEQIARLTAWQHALRWLWNLAHEQRLFGLHASVKRYYTAYDQQKELTELRAELSWLKDVPRNLCNALLVSLDDAWQRCFQRLARAPRFKHKGRDGARMCEPDAGRFRIEGQAIVFPKVGTIHAVIHRPLEGKQCTCSITQDGDEWYASISCEITIEAPPPNIMPAVAIDRGVVNIIADSNGRLVTTPLFAEKVQRRIAKQQRRIASKKRHSRNQARARARLVVLQRKSRRQREAVLHRESKKYANNHGTIIVEQLNIKSMTASAKGTTEEPGTNVAAKAGLNRSILNCGWGKFVEMLQYKALPHGGTVIQVSAAYSSQECAACHHVDAASRKSQSLFECVSCKHRDHADTNAAKVLLSRGTHGSAACGGSAARGLPTKQERRVARHVTRPKKNGADKAPSFRAG